MHVFNSFSSQADTQYTNTQLVLVLRVLRLYKIIDCSRIAFFPAK